MKYGSLVAMMAIVAMTALCSCGSEKAGTSFTLAPPNGSVAQPIDVAVTATFEDDVAEPISWLDILLLKKDDAGDSVCTAVTYDTTSRIATCEHDDLERGASYTITLTGLIAVNGEQATFTTEN